MFTDIRKYKTPRYAIPIFLKDDYQISHEPWFAIEILPLPRDFQSKTGFRILRIDLKEPYKTRSMPEYSMP